MTFEEIEEADESANPTPQPEGVETIDEDVTHRTFYYGLWKAKFKMEKLDQMKLLDPVGRKLVVTSALRTNNKRLKEEGLISVPDGSFDKAREAITDAVSEA